MGSEERTKQNQPYEYVFQRTMKKYRSHGNQKPLMKTKSEKKIENDEKPKTLNFFRSPVYEYATPNCKAELKANIKRYQSDPNIVVLYEDTNVGILINGEACENKHSVSSVKRRSNT